MANLRIIHDNAADRSTLTASSMQGAFTAANMLKDIKSQIHRSAGTSVSYTLVWPAGETVGMAALPATNLSADATIRVRLYSDAAGTNQLADSGALYACPGQNLGEWDWSAPLNQNALGSLTSWTAPLDANAFAYGGVSKTAVFFDEHYFVRRCVIDIADAGNSAGYIDCARIITGGYWAPTYNAAYGAQLSVIDGSTTMRSDAGDLLTDRGALHDTLSLDLAWLTEADRARLMAIIRNAGTSRNLFLSLLPGQGLSPREQDHMIYGKRANSAVPFEFFQIYSNKIEMEGW